MTNVQAIVAIMIMAVVTALLRFLPFALLRNGGKTPVVVEYLGKVLPSAIMAMLVVYCLKGLTFDRVVNWLPAIIAGVATSASYVLKKNTLISIILGTVLYMVLIRVM